MTDNELPFMEIDHCSPNTAIKDMGHKILMGWAVLSGENTAIVEAIRKIMIERDSLQDRKENGEFFRVWKEKQGRLFAIVDPQNRAVKTALKLYDAPIVVRMIHVKNGSGGIQRVFGGIRFEHDSDEFTAWVSGLVGGMWLAHGYRLGATDIVNNEEETVVMLG